MREKEQRSSTLRFLQCAPHLQKLALGQVKTRIQKLHLGLPRGRNRRIYVVLGFKLRYSNLGFGHTRQWLHHCAKCLQLPFVKNSLKPLLIECEDVQSADIKDQLLVQFCWPCARVQGHTKHQKEHHSGVQKWAAPPTFQPTAHITISGGYWPNALDLYPFFLESILAFLWKLYNSEVSLIVEKNPRQCLLCWLKHSVFFFKISLEVSEYLNLQTCSLTL